MARLEFAMNDVVSAAPQAGGPDALFELGLMYCAGREVAADLVLAHKWFNLAALRGNAEARRYRQEVARELGKAEIARAQKLAREWLAAN